MVVCYIDSVFGSPFNTYRALEWEIKSIIMANKELRTTIELITTVKGIGFIIASFLIVYMCDFTRFENWRKFTCYSGIAPFEHQSGTSVHARTQASFIANQQVKRLLHLAAMTAIHFDAELHTHYVRRQVLSLGCKIRAKRNTKKAFHLCQPMPKAASSKELSTNMQVNLLFCMCIHTNNFS